MVTNSVVVIGVGNEFRRDDAVGIHFARKISDFALPGVRVIENFGEGASLIEAWTGRDNVFVCDAVRNISNPGSIHILEPLKEKIASDFFNYSTHAFSLAEAIEVSRELQTLPKMIKIYGIEGDIFAAGVGLTPKVEQALNKVVAEVAAAVENIY